MRKQSISDHDLKHSCKLARRPAWCAGSALKITCQQTSYILLQSSSASLNIHKRLVQTSKPLWVILQCCEKPVWSVTSRMSHLADAWCVHCVVMASSVTLQPVSIVIPKSAFCMSVGFWRQSGQLQQLFRIPTALWPTYGMTHKHANMPLMATDQSWLSCHKQFSQHYMFHLYCCTSSKSLL